MPSTANTISLGGSAGVPIAHDNDATSILPLGGDVVRDVPGGRGAGSLQYGGRGDAILVGRLHPAFRGLQTDRYAGATPSPKAVVAAADVVMALTAPTPAIPATSEAAVVKSNPHPVSGDRRIIANDGRTPRRHVHWPNAIVAD